jgi:predicted nucleotidyltransferase
VDDAFIFIYGSSVKGYSEKRDTSFDEYSDFDVGIVSPTLYRRAKKNGIKIFNRTNTVAFNYKTYEANCLGLTDSLISAYNDLEWKRNIEVAVYEEYDGISSDVCPFLMVHEHY